MVAKRVVERVKQFHAETFLSSVAILAPRGAGTAMMVSPKMLIGAIVGKFITTEHEDGCECDSCRYEQLKQENIGAVRTQRETITEPIAQAFGSCAYLDFDEDPEYVDDEDVVLYITWFSDHFPDAYAVAEQRYGPQHIIDRLYHSTKSTAADVLYDIVLETNVPIGMSLDDLKSTEQYLESRDGLVDSWRVLEILSTARKEGERTRLEHALASDVP